MWFSKLFILPGLLNPEIDYKKLKGKDKFIFIKYLSTICSLRTLAFSPGANKTFIKLFVGLLFTFKLYIYLLYEQTFKKDKALKSQNAGDADGLS